MTNCATMLINGRECDVFAEDLAEEIMILIESRHEKESLPSIINMIKQHTGKRIAIIGVFINEWDIELMPWHDDMVSRNNSSGTKAEETLSFITDKLIPYVKENLGDKNITLGGFSLGGLFSIWASKQSHAFNKIAAMSPSLWIKKWNIYTKKNPTNARKKYS